VSRSRRTELAIPLCEQRTDYTCGPASLLCALRYLRVAGRATERSLAREMGSDPEHGTTLRAMLRAARRRWAHVRLVRRCDLRAALARGDVAICALAAWGDGHYACAVSADSRRFVFADTATGDRRSLSVRAMRERWDGTAILLSLAPRRRAGPTKPMG